MEIIGLVVVFIGGVLTDHFLFNKIAGLIAPEVAAAQTAAAEAKAVFDGLASRVAALEAKVTAAPLAIAPVAAAPKTFGP